VGPCHHGLACRRLADGGGDLEIWRVAEIILNKQSQKAEKRWSFS